ncbi:hypothetical protein, partial [Streptomyces sp. NPDC005131]
MSLLGRTGECAVSGVLGSDDLVLTVRWLRCPAGAPEPRSWLFRLEYEPELAERPTVAVDVGLGERDD